MRVLISILITAMACAGMYVMYMHSSALHPGGSAFGAITDTTVKVQLVNIAEAERDYYALNSSYASMDELKTAGALKLKEPDPTGYTYTVETSPSGFIATGKHIDSKGGKPSPDFPTLSIDESMKVHDGNLAEAAPAEEKAPEAASAADKAPNAQ
jgi:hypothetical protein